MDISKLGVVFYRDFEKEYFEAPKNAYLNYEPWDIKQKVGTFPKVHFNRKDPTCMMVYKNGPEKLNPTEGKELWLYEKNNKFVFQELECIKNGFDTKPPLIFWVEYLKEPTFILYKTVGFGITQKFFLVYKETNGYIYMGWTQDIKQATPFSYSTDVDWNEYHVDLVASDKKF